ncbi:hypothetical protein OGX94_11605 [Citrobacter sp. Cpo037]|uniref:hypothetical protein n=1 Tax=Citrobacter sp. Cpo037 TaxID=2985125 RepID=UPI002576CC6A|nr:hypothetical protein [Citrobacter sp. Cpo037]MDM2901171.1 hypothetical protein [Citrobacter sp. Cpo037]
MYKPVYAPFAVTYHGEWVEPETAAQEDYDILFCEFCRLKISVVIDELTGIKSFVHTPLRLEATMRLTICPYNKTASKFSDGQKAEYGPLPPVKPRQPPRNTTIQNWQCCWCYLCWNGEKVCPQCGEWIYTLEDNHL